jgi:dTMP kinase
MATGDLLPRLTLVLDLPPQAAQGRKEGPADRVESRGAEFLARVRAGFLAEAQRIPARIKVIDAARPPDAVQAALRHEVALVLGESAGS